MKKKGYTLIELLAVIVVLATIALIATPIVMNVIKNANMGAAERSADNYVKAVETLIATEKLDGTPMADGEYAIDINGKLTKDGKEYEVEVSGTKPVGGTVVITNGQVVKDNTTIYYTDHTVTFEDGVAKAEKKVIVVLCTATEPTSEKVMVKGFEQSIDVGQYPTQENPYEAGSVYKCDLGETEETQGLIFYVLSSTEDTVTLIMNKNIDDETVAWCLSGSSNTCAADGAIAALTAKTSGWTKLFKEKGNVDLPSYDLLNPFLYMDLIMTNTRPDGYWTSAAHETSGISAWTIDYVGRFTVGSVYNENNNGIRPVITISKDNMSL